MQSVGRQTASYYWYQLTAAELLWEVILDQVDI